MPGLGTKKTQLKGIRHNPITSDIKSEIILMHRSIIDRERMTPERIAEMLHVPVRAVRRILKGEK